MQKELLEIGKIVNTHGIKGELKLLPHEDDPGDLRGLQSLFIDGRELKVLSARVHKGALLVTLEGVNDMDAALNEHLHAENMAAFRYVLEASLPRRPAVWAAWGNIIEMRPYLPRCVSDMIAVGEELGAEWFTAGKRSVKGHPHHPLYLRRDTPLDPFDVKSYIDTLEGRTHHAEL